MIDVENTLLKYFETFKKKNKPKRYQEDCDDDNLKESIRTDLLVKQRGQCAYCERKLDKEKQNFHIEHIQPRDKDHKLECEYSNLVLSCNDCDSCGKYRKSNYWEDRFIHPVLNNPTEYFMFNEDGQILATDKNTIDTIEFLNLNSKKLIRLRKNIVFGLNSMKDIVDISEYFNEFENLVNEFKKDIDETITMNGTIPITRVKII